MFCPFCGKEAQDNAIFCSSCGRQMPSRTEQPVRQADPDLQAAQTEPPLTNKPDQPLENAQPVEPVIPVQPVAYAQPAQPAEPAQPLDNAQPVEPVQPAEPVEPARPAEYTQSADAAQQAQPIPPIEPAPVMQAEAPVQPVPVQPAPAPQIQITQSAAGPVTAGSTAQPAGAASNKSNKIKIMIAVAAAVVVLGGGFAAAWFSGALDSVFNRNPPAVASRTEVEETTTTTAEVKSDADENTTAEETTTATTAETTTAATTTTTAATTQATTTAAQSGGGGATQGTAFARKTSPAMSALLSDMNLTAYTSNDASSKGAVEETVINLSSLLLGGARNITNNGPDGGNNNIAGLEFKVAFDVTDAYIEELMPVIFGPFGADPQVLEIIRLAGASELGITVDIGGEIVDDMMNPVITLNADWLVKSNPFISLIGYFDLDDIFFAVPALTDKVFQTASTLAPIPAIDLETLKAQPAMIEDIGKYIDDLMPYIEQMAVAAINELNTPVEGIEELSLGGKNLVFDTIDMEITEDSAARAVMAALKVIKDNPEAQTLLVNAYNDIAKNIEDAPLLDEQTLLLAINGMLSQMSEYEQYPSSDEVINVRLYMYDGSLAGMAMSNPDDITQLGYVLQSDAGYSFWLNDFTYSEFEEINMYAPTQIDSGIGDRYEIHGTLSSGPNGLNGDFELMLRELDEVFDEKLMTFTDLNTKVMFGIPVPTGKFTVKMNDIYNAFIGKDSHYNSFVWETAYAMEDLDATPILKDLEFSLELSATATEYKMEFGVADPRRNSKASLSFKGYQANKTLTPPQGERVDINNTDQMNLMGLADEMMGNIYLKIDELVAAGYDLAWLKPVITAQLMGQGGDFGGDDDYGSGTGVGGVLSAGVNVDGYVFENSSEEILDPQTLIDLSPDLLIIARNEIYARHGWVFDNIDLQLYFNQQDWYVPLYNNDAIELNEIETVNVAIIAQVESIYANA